jgi:hypothetical protein
MNQHIGTISPGIVYLNESAVLIGTEPSTTEDIRQLYAPNASKPEPRMFPDELPSTPDLCDVHFDSGLKIENVYIGKYENQLQLYKSYYLTYYTRMLSGEWGKKASYLVYRGYDQVAEVFQSNCVVLKKS